METLDKALNIVKNTGFINYYGSLAFSQNMLLFLYRFRHAEIWNSIRSYTCYWIGPVTI